MNIGHLLFKTNGRIDVGTWWSTQVLLWMFVFITGIVWHKYGFHDAALGVIGTILLFWIRINLNVKRLHDINLSGWWLALFESFPVIGLLALWAGLGFWVSSVIVALGYLGGFCLLGFKKGTEGENEHGETPLS